ncbi:MAG: GNAT family N-acetyltransferase [Tabrizicola sp.]|nr:GNAT family N-acetyltransferase [Tabrizicola sp.]
MNDISIPALSLRHAEPSDAPIVLDFLKRLMTFQKLADEVTATATRIAALLRDGKSEAVLALQDGEAVGCMIFSATASAYTGRAGLFLDGFFVDDRMRGQGVGRAMMAHLARLSMDRGGEMLEWGCLDWNQPAIAFYRGLGAYALDEMRVYRLGPDRLAELAAQV